MHIEIDTGRLLILGALLFLLALSASSETAIFSLSRMQLRSLRERYKKTYEIVRQLLDNPSRFLILTLLLCEVISIVISSLVTEMVNSNSEYSLLYTSAISMGITLPLLLLIGEIPPKVIGARMNRIVTILNARAIGFIYNIFKPVILPIDWLVSIPLKRIKRPHPVENAHSSTNAISEEDFMTIMDEGHRQGSVNKDEREMIANVLEFDDIMVEEVMTSIGTAFVLPENSRIGDVLNEVKNRKYSRIPIYKKSLGNIIGIIHTKTLIEVMRNPDLENYLLRDLMKPVLIVHDETRLSTVFKKFKSEKTHIAVCQNSQNETTGIVTMDDLLESIFGDIRDT